MYGKQSRPWVYTVVCKGLSVQIQGYYGMQSCSDYCKFENGHLMTNVETSKELIEDILGQFSAVRKIINWCIIDSECEYELSMSNWFDSGVILELLQYLIALGPLLPAILRQL